jgi:glucan phosphorylase
VDFLWQGRNERKRPLFTDKMKSSLNGILTLFTQGGTWAEVLRMKYFTGEREKRNQFFLGTYDIE